MTHKQIGDYGTGRTLYVLGEGFVRLVDYMGGDISIVRAARVSYNADWRTGENEFNDERLIRSLMKRGHTSPFESVTFTFEVKAPIFVFRQWHRHRTQSYNEISARYTKLDEGFFVPEPMTITMQDPKNKQQRSGAKHPMADWFASKIAEHNRLSNDLYQAMLAHDCPRELARCVLPVSTYSRMFTTFNLHNGFRFLRERLSDGAQHEIKVYADAMIQLMEPIVPIAIDAFRESIVVPGAIS